MDLLDKYIKKPVFAIKGHKIDATVNKNATFASSKVYFNLSRRIREQNREKTPISKLFRDAHSLKIISTPNTIRILNKQGSYVEVQTIGLDVIHNSDTVITGRSTKLEGLSKFTLHYNNIMSDFIVPSYKKDKNKKEFFNFEKSYKKYLSEARKYSNFEVSKDEESEEFDNSEEIETYDDSNDMTYQDMVQDTSNEPVDVESNYAQNVDNTEDLAQQNINSDNINSDNINSDNINSDNINSDNINSDNVNSDNVNSDNINSDNVNSDNINSDNVYSNTN